MAENNKKYVELLWADKYDKFEKGEKLPIEKPNLPFQVVETIISRESKVGLQFHFFLKMNGQKTIQKTGKIFLSGVIINL